MSEPLEQGPRRTPETQKPAEPSAEARAARAAEKANFERMRHSFISVEDALTAAETDERTRSITQKGILTAVAGEKYNEIVFGIESEEQLPPEVKPLPDVVMETYLDGSKHPAPRATLMRRFEQQGMAALEPFKKAKLRVFDIDGGVEGIAWSVVGSGGDADRVQAMEIALGHGWRERIQQNLLAKSTYESVATQQTKDAQASTKKRSRIRAALDRLFGSTS